MPDRLPRTVLPTGLSRDYFVSPEIYSLESENVFSQNWICAAHRSELFGSADGAADDRCATRELENHAILFTLNAGGQLRALHNVCRHRGAQLVPLDGACRHASTITCPYHAWRYDLQGHLLGAPNMLDVEGFDRRAFPLREFSCVDWNGLILINFHKSPSAFHDDFQLLNHRLQNWTNTPWRLAEAIEYDVAANWKLIFQNYSECYHCPTVHPELNRLTPYKSASNDLTAGPILGGPMQLAHGFDTVSLDGKRIGPSFPGLDTHQRDHVYYYTIFPNMFVSAHPDYVMVHRLQRLSHNQTEVVCQFFTPDDAEADISRASQLWDQINRQDWHVCELTQRGVTSPGFQPGPYSNLEPMLAAFDRFYLQALHESPDAPCAQRAKR